MKDFLPEYFQSGQVFLLSNSAFNTAVFNSIYNLLRTQPNKPDIVVIPVNLQHFSSQWMETPHFKFKRYRSLLNIHANNGRLRDYFTVWIYSYTNLLKRETSEWSKKYNNNRLRTPAPKPGELECYPERKNRYKEHLRKNFSDRYHYRLKHDYPDILHLSNLINKLKQDGVQILVYVTPINMIDGVRFAGDEFRETVYDNIRLIEGLTKNYNIKLLNLADALPPENFTDQHIVTEHLDESGRKFIVKKIAETIRRDFGVYY